MRQAVSFQRGYRILGALTARQGLKFYTYALAVLIACTFIITPVLAQSPAPADRPSADTNPFFKPTEVEATKITLPRLSDLFGDSNSGQDTLQKIVNFIFDLLTLIIGIAAFLYLIYGGFLYITSAGRPDAVDQARKTITSAIIGIVIAAFAYIIVTYVIDWVLTYFR